jgi:hypothetical protein
LLSQPFFVVIVVRYPSLNEVYVCNLLGLYKWK